MRWMPLTLALGLAVGGLVSPPAAATPPERWRRQRAIPSLHEEHEDLLEFLASRFNVHVEYERLDDLLGFLLASDATEQKTLVVDAGASILNRVYLYVLVVSHILLRHTSRPFATILIPKRRANMLAVSLGDDELAEFHAADTLARAMLYGCYGSAWNTVLRELMPDSHVDEATRAAAMGAAALLPASHLGPIRQALALGLSTDGVLLGLELARTNYVTAKLRDLVGKEPLIEALRDALREKYWERFVRIAREDVERVQAERRGSLPLFS